MDGNWQKAADVLNSGGLAVIPTDSIYGIVAKALDPKAVEKLYAARGRDREKPCIILCSSSRDLGAIGLMPGEADSLILKEIWPNPVSVVLSVSGKGFEYLHRGKMSLAVRVPKKKELLELLRETGPILAPSANLEGQPPAKNIAEAKNYFGDLVGIYVEGPIHDAPSTLVELKDGKLKIIRRGLWKVPARLSLGVE